MKKPNYNWKALLLTLAIALILKWFFGFGLILFLIIAIVTAIIFYVDYDKNMINHTIRTWESTDEYDLDDNGNLIQKTEDETESIEDDQIEKPNKGTNERTILNLLLKGYEITKKEVKDQHDIDGLKRYIYQLRKRGYNIVSYVKTSEEDGSKKATWYVMRQKK